MPRRFSLALASAASLCSRASWADDPAVPVALDVVCDSDYRTGVTVDGIQADWEEEAAPAERVQQLVEGAWQYDYTGPNDASFRLWCRSSPDGIYLAVVGRDNVIVDPDDDEGDFFELRLIPDGLDDDAMRILRLDLGVVDGEGRADFVDDEGRSVVGAFGEVAPRESGYFVEAFVPAAVLGGAPFAPIRFAAFQRDFDGDTRGERVALIGTGASDESEGLGWLDFGLIAARIATIAERAHADNEPPHAQAVGNVGGTPGRDLVFALGDNLYVSGEGMPGFSWLTLVIRTSDEEEIESIELHDIDGDGNLEIFVRQSLPQHSLQAGLIRTDDVVHVFDLRGDTLVEVFAQVVATSLPDGRRLESEMAIAGRGADLSVHFAAATGDIDEQTWPHVDHVVGDLTGPLALPWVRDDGVVWTRHGDSWSVGEP